MSKKNPLSRPNGLSKAEVGRMFREVGAEVVDEVSGMTRLQAMIRSLYIDAVAGKSAAAEIILERGWGKVPTPIHVDLRGEIEGELERAGMTLAEAALDPILSKIIEGTFAEIDEPLRLQETVDAKPE